MCNIVHWSFEKHWMNWQFLQTAQNSTVGVITNFISNLCTEVWSHRITCGSLTFHPLCESEFCHLQQIVLVVLPEAKKKKKSITSFKSKCVSEYTACQSAYQEAAIRDRNSWPRSTLDTVWPSPLGAQQEWVAMYTGNTGMYFMSRYESNIRFILLKWYWLSPFPFYYKYKQRKI